MCVCVHDCWKATLKGTGVLSPLILTLYFTIQNQKHLSYLNASLRCTQQKWQKQPFFCPCWEFWFPLCRQPLSKLFKIQRTICGWRCELFIQNLHPLLLKPTAGLHFPAPLAVWCDRITGFWPVGCERKWCEPFPGQGFEEGVLLHALCWETGDHESLEDGGVTRLKDLWTSGGRRDAYFLGRLT